MILRDALRGQYDPIALEQLQVVYDQAAVRLYSDEVSIDPIEEVPFPVAQTRAGEIASWVLDELGYDDFIEANYEKLMQSPIRVVFVVHDTAGVYNNNTGLEDFQVKEWNGDNTGTGAADDHNHSHNVASCILGNKPGTRMGLLRRLAEVGKVVVVADKVMSRGSGAYTWISSGYNRTVDLPYQENDLVIHVSSFGGGGSSGAIIAAMERGEAKGQLWFASAGNSGHNPSGQTSVGFPANHEIPIAVGAVDRNMNRKSYSSTGPEVYSTNGSGVPAVNRDGSINNVEGTSFSQPINAALIGLVALYLGRKVTQEEAKEIIRTRSNDLGEMGRDTFFGYGIQTSETIKEPGEDPGNPDPEPPTEPGIDPYVLTVTINGVTERWKTISEQRDGDPLRTVWYESVTITVKADEDAPDFAKKVASMVLEYANRHYLVVPDDYTEKDVVSVAARFLDIWMDRQYGVTIDPKEVVVVGDANFSYTLAGDELQRWKKTPEDELTGKGFKMQPLFVS